MVLAEAVHYFGMKLQVIVLEANMCSIDILIKDVVKGHNWRATFMYGEPKVENGQIMWGWLMSEGSILSLMASLWRF
jgi:hypothetical protein